MGKENNALLIDCRSNESKLFPLNDPDLSFLVINSNVKHQLEGSEYSSRRKQCEDVARIIGKKSLRDATLQDLLNNRDRIDQESFRRAKHAITEIERTFEASKALTTNNMKIFGELMNQSHDSLRLFSLFFILNFFFEVDLKNKGMILMFHALSLTRWLK